jgi:hypothetical protein
VPKPIIIGLIAAGVVVIAGVTTVLVVNNQSKSSDPNQSSSQSSSKEVALVDPEGTYNYLSDPSVTKFPEKNAVFGNGQTFTFEYDGSKTNNDESATLSYQLYYIQDDGKVQPMGGGNLSGTGKGTFATSDKVFNSSASGHSGFFELIGTYDTSFDENYKISGHNVTLGMYPIKFEIAE